MSTRPSLRARIRERSLLVGTIITAASTEIAEALGWAGLDWLFLDLEHGAIDVPDALRLAQSAPSGCYVVARVATNDPLHIRQAMDVGVDGVIVPLVNSEHDARRAIDAMKYPPEGSRSVGMARAHRYGLDFEGYVERANRDIAAILQVEHADAVANLDGILSVQGIDAIFIGPYDLSGSLGLFGQISHPTVSEAVAGIFERCERRGVPTGMFAATAEGGVLAASSGAVLVAVGSDLHHMASSAAAAARAVRDGAGSRRAP